MSSRNIVVVTKLRGFFRELTETNKIDSKFVVKENSLYELSSKNSKILSKIIRLKIFDIFPLIQEKKVNVETEKDIYFSFNRFVKLNKDTSKYIIYLENPTALFHYSIRRSKTILGKKKIKKKLSNKSLASIVFMSRACMSTFNDVCGEVSTKTIKKQIYPLVRENKNVSLEIIEKK